MFFFNIQKDGKYLIKDDKTLVSALSTKGKLHICSAKICYETNNAGYYKNTDTESINTMPFIQCDGTDCEGLAQSISECTSEVVGNLDLNNNLCLGGTEVKSFMASGVEYYVFTKTEDNELQFPGSENHTSILVEVKNTSMIMIKDGNYLMKNDSHSLIVNDDTSKEGSLYVCSSYECIKNTTVSGYYLNSDTSATNIPIIECNGLGKCEGKGNVTGTCDDENKIGSLLTDNKLCNTSSNGVGFETEDTSIKYYILNSNSNLKFPGNEEKKNILIKITSRAMTKVAGKYINKKN